MLTIGYALVVNAAYVLALLLRFEGQVPARYWHAYLELLPAYTLLSLLGYFLAGLYHGLWRYASTVTLLQVIKGVTLSATALVLLLFVSPVRMFPTSLIAIIWLLEVVMVGGTRFLWRMSRDRILGPAAGRIVPTLIIGTDHRAVDLVQEMRRRYTPDESFRPLGYLDRDERLTGHLIEGLEVLGTLGDLTRVIRERDIALVVVADRELHGRILRDLARACAECGVRVKTLPDLSDVTQGGRMTLAQMKDIDIEDLLGREPVHLDLDEVGELLRGQTVLVTGAGGSIGSELARQVAEFGAGELVLLDHAENGLYFVHHELAARYPRLTLHAVVCDIRDRAGLDRVFAQHRPAVVLHAAAHKHVPLLETSPREAVLNNIVGTRNLVDAADRAGVGKFVLISTDKAVNPSSVMGASKRICEMLLQAASRRSATRFCAVRFGNVLGSDGSVIPLFQRQLQRGGPLTVTHPETRRYFMTIPEASRLVLQASAMGRGGEVFLLDMGEQVSILELARQLIRLSGLREGEDIEIVFTGLRPGEKLVEELHSHDEGTRMTRHERIMTWELWAPEEADLRREVEVLERIAEEGDPGRVKAQLHRIVPEYHEPTPEELALDSGAAKPPEAPAAPQASADPRPTRPVGEALDRGLDPVVALLALVLSSPLWLALFIESRVTGGGLFAREVRIGRTRRRGQRRGRRSTVPLDRRSIDRRTQDLCGAPVHCLSFRTDTGPVARFVARHRLEKLPWLLQVLSGEFALVGPKPDRQELVQRWHHLVPRYAERFRVRPGVTGLAQVSGVTDRDADGVVRRVHYDLYYIEHRSLALDLSTLARTMWRICRPMARA